MRSMQSRKRYKVVQPKHTDGSPRRAGIPAVMWTDGTILHVLRTRVRPPDLYKRHARGWVLTVSTRTGQEIYVKRSQLKPVAAATTDQETETP